MENQTPTTPKSRGPIIGLATIAVLIVGGIFAFASGLFKTPQEQNNTQPTNNDDQSVQNGDSQNGADTPTSTDTTPEPQPQTSKYKDGTYTVNQTYRSPGGDEKFVLTMTIQNDIVTGTTFTPNPVGPIGQQKQTAFNSAYKTEVIGKSIDSISLTVVNGASLTTKGFMSALETIKAEAQS